MIASRSQAPVVINIHVEEPIEIVAADHPVFVEELRKWARAQPKHFVDFCNAGGIVEVWVHGGDAKALAELKRICAEERARAFTKEDRALRVVSTDLRSMAEQEELVIWSGTPEAEPWNA